MINAINEISHAHNSANMWLLVFRNWHDLQGNDSTNLGMYVHMVRGTCWISKGASEWRRNGTKETLKVANMAVGSRRDADLLHLGFHNSTTICRAYREKSWKKKM